MVYLHKRMLGERFSQFKSTCKRESYVLVESLIKALNMRQIKENTGCEAIVSNETRFEAKVFESF